VFYATSLVIVSMLSSTAWGSYPSLLIATNDPANSLNVSNATAGVSGVQAGRWWLLFGFLLLLAYQEFAHRLFLRKMRSMNNLLPSTRGLMS
jgi:cytochrome bd ubiquinol oxidase subunit II